MLRRAAVLPRLSARLLAGRYLSVTPLSSTEAAAAASPQEAFVDAAAIAAELNGEPDAAALERGVVGVTKARRARRRASPVSAAAAGSQPQQSRATAIWTAYSRFDEVSFRARASRVSRPRAARPLAGAKGREG